MQRATWHVVRIGGQPWPASGLRKGVRVEVGGRTGEGVRTEVYTATTYSAVVADGGSEAVSGEATADSSAFARASAFCM